MQIETIPVLGDNYAYLVICEETGKAAAIDPADPQPVWEAARARGVELVAVWCTHHHWDHVGGNEQLAQQGAAVFGHRSDQTRIPRLTCPLDDGDEVSLGRLTARVIHTPGHTRGALVYLIEDAAFTGDTLFAAGCGRLFEGTAADLFHSLHEKLLPRLQPETRIFCGHNYLAKNLAFAAQIEPKNRAIALRRERVDQLDRSREPTVPTALAEERETNPFLRVNQPSVCDALRQACAQKEIDDPAKRFAQLRQLRDQF